MMTRICREILSQRAVERAAEALRCTLRVSGPDCQSPCKKGTSALAYGPFTHLRAALDNLARGVRAQDERQFLARVVLARRHHHIARVERCRLHADHDLARPQLRSARSSTRRFSKPNPPWRHTTRIAHL
jgi:hypothetical protein